MNWCYTILSFNHNEHTRNCIRSVLAVSPESRIYVIHNGTEPKQRHIVEAEFQNRKNISHIVMEKNIGYSGGLNFGLNAVFQKENFVFVLTNDTELVAVPKYPVKPGLVVPLILNKRTGKIDSFGGYFLPGQGHIYHNKQLSAEFTDSGKQKTYIPGSGFLVERESFLKSGGFIEQLGTYWEDVDWSQRLKSKNIPLVLNADFQLSHKIGKTCHKDKFYTTYLFQRNRLIVSWKYGRAWQRFELVGRSCVHLIKWVLKSAINANYESLALYLRALRHAIKMIKENRI